MPFHSCNYCNYNSDRVYNLQKKKYGNQQNESQLKTSYMQDYPHVQPIYHRQVVQQHPFQHDQVDHSPQTQINSLKNALETQNQHLQRV